MDVHQYYDTNYPGQVEVVGVEMWTASCNINGTRAFKNSTGATYPILLGGDLEAGGNFYTLYGTYDNYIVVNKQGIVRYHAAQLHGGLGDRYDLNEIRATVDSLVSETVSVDPADGPGGFTLRAAPNPFRGRTHVSLSNPSSAEAQGRVTVHDLAGRRVAVLRDGAFAPGTTRLEWNGTDASGAAVRPGVYVIQAIVGNVRLTRRVALLR